MTAPSAVWALDTGRPGEFMQLETLGRALDLGLERIRIAPDGTLMAILPAAPPRLILSFGATAQAALRLASQFAPRPLTVHLGTPGHTPITKFDLIIPMPQDDYPPAPNVFLVRLPLNGASLTSLVLPTRTDAGHCMVVIGGPSRHFRLPDRTIHALLQFGARLAEQNSEQLQIVTSPRTPAPILSQLKSASLKNGFTLHEYGQTPFASILRSGSRFVVTADSASMLAETCRTGAPVWLFPLPPNPNPSDFLQRTADRFLGQRFRHRLVRRGWVGGGTDFSRWHRLLESHSYIRIAGNLPDESLHWAPAGTRQDTDLRDCRARILAMLG